MIRKKAKGVPLLMDKMAFLLGICFFLSGCSVQEKNLAAEQEKPFSVSQEMVYDVYMEAQNYPYARYEPKSGCYLGVDISENDDVEGCIEEFEKTVGITHQLYVNTMQIGQVYPLQWVLECYTREKIPVITMTPYDTYLGFDKTDIEQTASEFGMIDIPIFVQLLPDPLLYGKDAKEYVEYYQYVRQIFEEKAPNVAFIWSIDRNTIQESEAFYPGDAYVDWVGLNIYEENLDKDDTTLWDQLNYFYYSFQKRKPMMISQLGVSHYSTKDHSYQIKEAAEKIEQIYEELQKNYPRIKGVIYINRNGTAQAPKSAIRNDFTVTGDKDLTAAYERAVSGEYFGAREFSGYERIRSPFPALVIEDKVFIAKKTWIYDMEKKEERSVTLIDGREYIELTSEEAEVDDVGKKVIIKH